MQQKRFNRNISQIYLTLVTVLTVIFGLGVGYISYRIYLPIWIVLMILATWTLGAHVIKTHDVEKKHIVACAVFFIIPIMLTSMFFGLGAPPDDRPKAWVASATEQQVRYYFLLATGVLIAFGFAILREKLKKAEENFYSLLGSIAIQIAIPIFLVNMTFWGFYLTRLYQIMAASSLEKTPEWVLPLRNQFYFINMIVTALVYLATAAFAASLKKAGWFKPTACNVYILISLLFFFYWTYCRLLFRNHLLLYILSYPFLPSPLCFRILLLSICCDEQGIDYLLRAYLWK